MGFRFGVSLVALMIALAGCGQAEDVVMPDVETKRLDIALSDLERAGVEDEAEVLGGGTFGVVDESNWFVCDQDPAAGGVVGSVPRLTVDRTCAQEDDLEGDQSQPEPESAQESDNGDEAGDDRQKPSRRDRDDKGAQTKPAETFAMPALVGSNLQDAQDTLQALGSYILTQTDGTGRDRFQVLDSGWKVCAQRPAAGTTTPVSTMVELITVKLHESCL